MFQNSAGTHTRISVKCRSRRFERQLPSCMARGHRVTTKIDTTHTSHKSFYAIKFPEKKTHTRTKTPLSCEIPFRPGYYKNKFLSQYTRDRYNDNFFSFNNSGKYERVLRFALCEHYYEINPEQREKKRNKYSSLRCSAMYE